MDENNSKNLILAMVLSALVIVVWFYLFPPPEPEVQAEAPVATQTTGGETPVAEGSATSEPVPEAPRLRVDTPQLEGSISLLGGRIDDLRLKNYREAIEPTSPIVRLLTPQGEEGAWLALFGWGRSGSLAAEDVPGAQTEWRLASGGTLSPGNPVTLIWENSKGLTFTRELAVDDEFMFTIKDSVVNGGAGDVSLFHYGQIRRYGKPAGLKGFFILHEGAIARADGKLTETTYNNMTELDLNEREGAPASVVDATTDGWIGFTDHYWMSVLVPEQGKPVTQVTKYLPASNLYLTEARQPLTIVTPGETLSTSTRFFAGAKEWEAIRDYQNEPGFFARLFGDKVDETRAPIPGFIDSIDWGWFYFLTKPIFALLHLIHGLIGNMGLAIIALTFVLKLIVLPLAYKSYVSMARMKELQPEMEALKERAGEDKQRLQKEMLQLYRDKKVNPAAGCLPILIQIPIFFSLYKVIFVTIELRQAPFFGWLKDLSVPDPSSLFNLFGALPWAAPATGSLLHLVFIGVLPILLGVSMWLQQKLNPAPADPVQASIFAWMPWVFMFMLGGFASGLVVYWITNNIITFSQQYVIMRSHGHKPDLFGNIKSGFRKKQAAANANAAPSAKAGTKNTGKK
ncbi:membrane protein insertase YidC [Xinfangfangia sp. D13-10-4-6]|uniref:membrane protein insertase YidC n=1 Tax=Pseudogemmobacter hezensis TaxID=2737662 RepID=UPI00155559E4|nr:membrane protein insertase YidC [Pseudogemmobacter hezensis]NPD17240.1 membrane protein insertase YidC [Pseudogemmobacter hezensis]